MKMLSLLKKLNNTPNGLEYEKLEDEVFAYALDLYERVAKGKDNTKLASMSDIEALNECMLYLLSKQISRAL